MRKGQNRHGCSIQLPGGKFFMVGESAKGPQHPISLSQAAFFTKVLPSCRLGATELLCLRGAWHMYKLSMCVSRVPP